jgi:hypothetical protein
MARQKQSCLKKIRTCMNSFICLLSIRVASSRCSEALSLQKNYLARDVIVFFGVASRQHNVPFHVDGFEYVEGDRTRKGITN